MEFKSAAVSATVVLALATLFTFLAIFDSDKLPFLERFIFWCSTIGAGILVAAFIKPWVMSQLLPRRAVALQLMAIGAFVSLPIPFILFWFDTGFKQAWPLSNWGFQYLLSFVIAILVVSGDYLVRAALSQPKIETVTENEAEACVQKFLKRLPIQFHSAKLYAISSEDHYLRIHTDCGDELILMRLADAMHELKSADGTQTHRSWWVAREGIAKVTGKNGKKSLLLKCGTEAPISRARARQVQEVFLSPAS